MSRLLGLCAAALLLAACGPSQGDISAAIAFDCERQGLEEQIEREGETPELRLALDLADVNMISVIEESGAPDEVYAAVRAADCP